MQAPFFTLRILTLPAALAAGLLVAAPALAQTAPSPPPSPQAKGEPSARPKLPRDRRVQLDALFEALRLAPDEASAKALGTRLDSFFAQTGSPSADLLMGRAELAAEAKEYDLAVELLDAAIAVAPDNLTLLSRRASIKYAQDDYAGTMSDLSEVLAREPRHYTALLGLALVMREVGDDKHALDAARRALAVNPHLDAAKEIVDDLKVSVEGRDI